MQATVYCGAPAGNHAAHEAEEAFKEMAKYGGRFALVTR